jgi:hypothetical protein
MKICWAILLGCGIACASIAASCFQLLLLASSKGRTRAASHPAVYSFVNLSTLGCCRSRLLQLRAPGLLQTWHTVSWQLKLFLRSWFTHSFDRALG